MTIWYHRLSTSGESNYSHCTRCCMIGMFIAQYRHSNRTKRIFSASLNRTPSQNSLANTCLQRSAVSKNTPKIPKIIGRYTHVVMDGKNIPKNSRIIFIPMSAMMHEPSISNVSCLQWILAMLFASRRNAANVSILITRIRMLRKKVLG